MPMGLHYVVSSILFILPCIADTVERAPECTLIVEEGRQACGRARVTQSQCGDEDCCWDGAAKAAHLRCHTRVCRARRFGWACRFTCRCSRGDVCNPVTGQCGQPCPNLKWGVGCMLMSKSLYNDRRGVAYMGRRDRTEQGYACESWTAQTGYANATFPRRSQRLAYNYCRNPSNDPRPWCYTKRASEPWAYCKLSAGTCPRGRYSVNCQKECHCVSLSERCHQTYGTCRGGCHRHWQGADCQECAAGRYGTQCERGCVRCARGLCDRMSGDCDEGCVPGWTGTRCKTACADGRFGDNCQHRCNCEDASEVCSGHSGHCQSGCADRFNGPGCLIQVPGLRSAPQKAARDRSSVSVRWDAWSRSLDSGSGPVTAYVVYYTNALAQRWTSVRTDYTQVTVDDLKQLRSYRFKVAPVHKLGFEGRASPELMVSTCGKPNRAPQNVVMEIDESTLNGEIATLKVSWKSPPAASWNCDRIVRYRVYHKRAPGGYCEDTTTLSFSIHRVNVSANYSVRVTLINDVELESQRSNTVYFLGRRRPVRNLVITPLSSRGLRVTWDAPIWGREPVAGYTVAYRLQQAIACTERDPPSEWSNPKQVSGGEGRVYEVSGLLAHRHYAVRVWAEDSGGQAGHPLQASGVTLPAAPTANVTELAYVEIRPTLARFTWRAPDCHAVNGPGLAFGYRLRAVAPAGPAARVGRTTGPGLQLTGLTPYTKYALSMWLSNEADNGTGSKWVEFTTPESTPGVPRAVQTDVLAADTLVVTWVAPRPANGALTGYSLLLYRAPRRPDKSWQVDVAGGTLRYEVKGLQTSTSYGIEVRASTSVGPGNWSKPVFGFTEEGFPDAPVNLVNVSKTETTLGLSWSDPEKTSGQLRKFKIACQPGSSAYVSLMSKSSPPPDKELNFPTRETVMTGLQPGSKYECNVRASTERGYGAAVTGTYWTAPPPPEKPSRPRVMMETQTDTTVELELSQLRFSTILENSQSTYQVVVEELASRARRRRRSAPTTPCGLPPGDLLGYYEATRRGLACYVAAAVPTTPDRQASLVVGSGETDASGYYNAPLRPGHTYDVWFGSLISVDGVTTATFSKAASSIYAAEYMPSSESGSVVLGASIGAAIALLLLAAIVILLLLRRRRRALRKGTEAARPMEREAIALSAAQLPEDPHKAMLPDVCADDESPDVATPTTSLLFSSIADDDDTASHQRPVAVDDLSAYVKLRRPSGPDSLVHEFDELRHGLQAKCLAALENENKPKNRYGNIIAYDHSRVILDGHTRESHQGYINASFIDAYRKPNAYIATQGPSKQTANDLWKLAWQQNSHRIVMVTNLVEDGRRKCEQYWPEDSPVSYGGIEIVKTDQEHYADFTIRTFSMCYDRVTKTLLQFHFTSWPDHGVPLYAISLLAFRKKVRAYDDATAGPTIVHCSAGVGRTGTFIALDCLLDQAKVEGQVDVCNTVYQMRRKRVNMVQTQEQYVFVYDALLEALRSGDTAIACADFPTHFAHLLSINPDTGKLCMLDEFELLMTVSPPSSPAMGCNDALDPENIDKNRNMQVLPMAKVSRPFIQTYIHLSNDYINAVFVDGYKQRDAFIATQMPLPNTVNDFWAMMYDHQCKTIVMMNELDTQDVSCACYYPDQGVTWSFGPFSVKTTAVDSLNPDVTIRDMTLTYSGKKQVKAGQVVRHFQFHGWPERCSLPTSLSSIMSLLSVVERWQQRSGNRHIVVHCMDGATQCGLFCAVSCLVERLKVEHEVDTFQSVKHSRINRPQLIPTLEQYHFLYDVAREYMDSFGTYANFK